MISKAGSSRTLAAILGFSSALSVFVMSAHGADQTKTAPGIASTASAVDQLIESELRSEGKSIAPPASDEDFLRRVVLDLAGRLPRPSEMVLFSLDPGPFKRDEMIRTLLESDDYAANWSRYWRDVIFSRATNMRAPLAQSSFEAWMKSHLQQNTPWDQVAQEVVTATGDVRENGATALIFAQEGEAADVAAEMSRIFLGIQIQCANCHDHPWDDWTREQFHELAAFFPRISVRPIRVDNRIATYEVVSVNASRSAERRGPVNRGTFMRFDRNRNGLIEKREAADTPLERFFDRLIENADRNKDGALSMQEAQSIQIPQRPGQGRTEHLMPNLETPSAPGQPMKPRFFATGAGNGLGTSDRDRRELLARQMTTPDNPWFARALVNRLWNELLGEGFYSPVDDLGPGRTPSYPAVLEKLSDGFVQSGYDVRWLLEVITRTRAYQRGLAGSESGADGLAANQPTRLRSDQLFDSIQQVLGGSGDVSSRPTRRGPYPGQRSPRNQFNLLFGFDPSTPNDEKAGSIPQALFLMNSPIINRAVQSRGDSRVARILKQFPDNKQAVKELYLQTLVREPTEKELLICKDYIRQAPSREEGFEDLLWSLLNSSEFLLRR